MQSSGHLFLPDLLHVDLRCCVDTTARSVTWGWKVSDLLTRDTVWICSHPHAELLPSGRWLARSLLEGSDIIRALVAGEPFPPRHHRPPTDGDAAVASPASDHS